ncbi:MAG: DUF1573 domain-containing protein [Bacteroidales bacterium]|nr:DUF1573 domain-containing protein [Bacteroidales bacterium]MDT8373913.1 DUF1573 domain-containing protein [Bacteroidales bacterium]
MMKNSIYVLTAALAVMAVMTSSCGGNSSGAERYMPSDTTGTAVMTFQSPEHNFGKVGSGEKVGCIFTFRNTGDADLVITSATASCGCTVPKYDRKPVPPEGTGTVEVIFDTSGREGLQTKTIVIQSNAENNLVILRIIAEVENK